MICAGTGITPMYPILTSVLETLEDNTHITMLYVNKTKKDIMLKKQLSSLQKKYPNQYLLYNCHTQDTNSKAHFTGRVNKTILEKVILTKKSIVMICGPNSFVNSIYSNIISLGFDKNFIVIF
jgi:ferredoxin-NADP reductase